MQLTTSYISHRGDPPDGAFVPAKGLATLVAFGTGTQGIALVVPSHST